MDYVIHFLIELVGQAVLWAAYGHGKVMVNPRMAWNEICQHPWHRPTIWFIGTVLTTIITVNLVG